MRVTRFTAACILGGILASGCKAEPEEWARARVIGSLDEGIGGPKAQARPGDIVLENDRVRVAILAAVDADGEQRVSMGPGLYGGSIADADVQWGDPRWGGGKGNDQFAEFFPTTNMNVHQPLEADDVEIVEDGSDGGPAVVRVTSASVPYLEMLRALWALTRQPEMYLITEYTAEPGVPWITVDSTVYFGWDGAGDPPAAEPIGGTTDTIPVIDWAVESGVVLGDFYLSGGSIDVFSPDLGFDEDGAVDAARGEGRNLFLDPFKFDFLAGVGDGVSYGLAAADGASFVPLFTSSMTAVIGGGREGTGAARFPAGTAFSYRRYFFVGAGDVGDIVDGWVVAKDVDHGFVEGHVIEESTGFPLSGVDVFAFKPGAAAPWSQWTTDVDPRDAIHDGSFGGSLPVGDWELLVHKAGRPDSERVSVTVGKGDTEKVALISPRPGLLSFTVRDEENRAVPAKVSIFAADGDSPRDPSLGDGFVAGSPAAVVWPMYGHGEVELPDGRYFAVASRGLEYELDETPTFEIEASQRHHFDLQVVRSLDTSGWVSADLHVHSSPSHDSGVSRVDRVRTMVGEGVEFFAATDHDHITDFAPIIEDLGMTEWVASTPGNETTTIEVGHFLGFPMAEDFTGDAGGAFDWTGLGPEEILDELRAAGTDAGFDATLFVGHPRAGILGYFDQYGFDPYGGVPGTGGNPGQPIVSTPTLGFTNPLLDDTLFTLDFDGIELFGTKDHYYFRTATQPELDTFAVDRSTTIYQVLERTLQEQADLEAGTYHLAAGQWGQVDDWFTLLNLGFKHTALANSDTHDWTGTEAGCPRNYVVSGTDDPQFIDDQEIADAVRDHRVIATYGPFVQMWVDDAPIGSEITPDDATVEIVVDVQAPSWMDLDRVELYQNGRLIDVIEVPQSRDPYRLTATREVTVEADAWFVAIAMGDGDLAPVFTPVEIPSIPLNEVVVEALVAVESVAALLPAAVPMPREYPIHPYGLTNPVWIDLEGDGFDAPGVPSWMRATEPE